MQEKIWEKLSKAADGLHWLGKYEECNALCLTVRLMRTHGIDTLEQWQAFVTDSKA